MLLIAAASVAALAAINAAMDGSEAPRVRTSAQVSLPAAHAAEPAKARYAESRPAFQTPTPQLARAEIASGLADLERQLIESEAGARDLVLQKLLPALFAQDRERLARFAELQSDPALRELIIRQVALSWGASDPERAVNWARALPDANERDATITDIANGLSSVDPAGGVQLRERFVGNTQADSALSSLVQQWAGFDFEAALAWTDGRAPGAQRDDLLQRIIYVRAASGAPAAAARLVDGSALAGAAKNAAVASVVQEWAGRDGGAALEWLDTLDPATRSAQAEEVARLRASAD